MSLRDLPVYAVGQLDDVETTLTPDGAIHVVAGWHPFAVLAADGASADFGLDPAVASSLSVALCQSSASMLQNSAPCSCASSLGSIPEDWVAMPLRQGVGSGRSSRSGCGHSAIDGRRVYPGQWRLPEPRRASAHTFPAPSRARR